MSQVLIFSDNTALIKLWSLTLTSKYKIDVVNNIQTKLNAAAVIISSDKIEENKNLLSLFKDPNTRFLVIGSNWPEIQQINALVHGAAGYCNESESAQVLPQALECILKGDIWIQRHLIPKVIGALIIQKTPPVEEKIKSISAESSKLLESLSNRELDVAKMIRTGENNKMIASSLHISDRTVKAHLTSIFKKLNVPDRLHLALFIKEFD